MYEQSHCVSALQFAAKMTRRTPVAVILIAIVVGLGGSVWGYRVLADKPDPRLAELAHHPFRGTNFKVSTWHASPVSRDDSAHPLGGSNDFLGDGRSESTVFVYNYTEGYAFDGVVEAKANGGRGYAGNFVYRYHDAAEAARAAQAIADVLLQLPHAQHLSFSASPGLKTQDTIRPLGHNVPYWRAIMFPGSEGTVLYYRITTQKELMSLLIVEGATQASAQSVFTSLIAQEQD